MGQSVPAWRTDTLKLKASAGAGAGAGGGRKHERIRSGEEMI